MIKLLLVDDEPLVLVGLQTMLPWGDYGIEICGTARSGAHALEIVERKRPDIIITDIMMPLRSGLELMESCRESYGRIPLFIILTCVEEFQHVKQAMRSQAVDYLIKLELTPEMLSQSVIKALDILESLGRKPETEFRMQTFYDRFFMDLLNNRFESTEQLEAKRAELGIDLSSDGYIVCYCQLDGLEGADTKQLMDLHNSTTRMVWETINKLLPCYITSVDLHQFTIVFCLAGQDISDILRQTIQLIKNYFNVDLSCCLGVKVASTLAISDSYNTARMALTAIDRVYPIHFYNKKGHADQIVNQVKEYIMQNLDKRLNLNQVADVFGFSPKYISLLFAKHGDCSFIEYINAEKIALAKELLLANNAKVYEISEQLGFESSFYFSKVFKKHTGLSPRDYMRKF
ncbi:MAG: response regulator [Defluviitaleaceae bacterium]|nr:response regulator [Defluviitaleaceae bacterium]